MAAMDLELAHGDICAFSVDAVVNAANPQLAGGGGVDGAIHEAAGPVLAQECQALRSTPEYRHGLPTGRAVETSGGNLCRWVIHTVGPVYDPRLDQRELLRACYTNSLAVADRIGAKTVALPLISAGAHRWPRRDALEQALGALCAADTQVEKVLLVLYDERTLRMARELLSG
jgi:O-acetyl-ADP-ribose deacetylase